MFAKWFQTVIGSRKFQIAMTAVATAWVSYFQGVFTVREAIGASMVALLLWVIAQAQVDAAEKRNEPLAKPDTRVKDGL